MKALFSLFALGVVLVASTSTASAAVWTFASGDSKNEFNVSGTGLPVFGTNETIVPHPNWEQNHDTVEGLPGTTGGQWISFGQTGYNGAVIPNVNTIFGFLGLPSAIFFEKIDLTGVATLADAKLSVWADDTASVSVVSNDYFKLLQGPNSGDLGTYCVDGKIGCTPDNGWRLQDITSSLVAGQVNYLVFGAYQRGGGPFGLMYEGFYSDGLQNEAPTPEPATLGLIGSSLMGLAVWSRRRNKSAATK